MKFCTKCGKELNANGTCDCTMNQAAPVESTTEQATPVVPTTDQNNQVNIHNYNPNGQMPNNMGQPMMGAPVAQGPSLMDQVKKIFSNGLKIFSKPEEAIHETSNDSDIKSLGIMLTLSTIVLFVMTIIFEKIFQLFVSIQFLAEKDYDVKFLDLAEGMPNILGTDKIGGLMDNFEFENYIKLFIACLGVVIVFFLIHAVMSFVIAKMDGKNADFKNVLVSSNFNSFVVTIGLVVIGITTAINGTIAYAAIMFLMVYFAMTTYQYLKIKFDISTIKLVYMVPALVIVNVGVGVFIGAQILKALEIFQMMF